MDNTEVNRDQDATVRDEDATTPAGQADADHPETAQPTAPDPDREPKAPGSRLGPGWQPV